MYEAIITAAALVILAWIVYDVAQSKKPLIKGDEAFNQDDEE